MLISKGIHLPDESQMEPKKFLLYNIAVMLLVPILAVFITAGAYVVGLVLGIIVLVALVILLFMFAGPIAAILVLVLVALLFGGGAAAINAIGNGMETVVSFIAMAIPAVLCLSFGIAMLRNAKGFTEKRTVVFAYITAAAYLVAIIFFIVSAVMMSSDGESGIGMNVAYQFGMMIPSIARLFYTIFGYKEISY